LHRSDGRQGEAYGDEHLLDVVAVERTDEDHLDEEADDRAGQRRHGDRQGEPQAHRHRGGQRGCREPPGVGAGDHEGTVGEVEHAHQAVDQAEPRRGQEVERTQA